MGAANLWGGPSIRPLDILCGAAALLRGSGRFREVFHKAIVAILVFPIGSAWLRRARRVLRGCHGVSVVLQGSFRGLGRAAHPIHWHLTNVGLASSSLKHLFSESSVAPAGDCKLSIDRWLM